jgi:curved DNA-binding protein CbpA
MSRGNDTDVPFYLMPVAAVLGMYAVAGSCRLLYLLHAKVTKKPIAPVPTSSYLFLIATTIAAVLAYGKVVASVNNAMEASSHAHFDPFELLQINESANITEIKSAYRSLSKLHHPDKGGSQQKFQKIHLAYQALTDKEGILNYQQYGHPEGPPSHSAMAFALPSWLLQPEGNVAVVLILLYLGMFVGIIIAAMRMVAGRGSPPKESAQDIRVAVRDAEYLAALLTPTTTHMDLLYMLCTTPQNIFLSEATLDHVEMLKRNRLKKLEVKEENKLGDFDLGDGWAEEDDEEDEEVKQAAAKAKAVEEDKKREREQLNAAQGKPTALLEGIDDGVIGQKWVEQTLGDKWPPKNFGWLKGKTFDYKGKQVKAMDHPAIRRNLCFTTGRLNSILLNNHPDLLEAGPKGLIDPTYFKATGEYRQRTSLLLEAALKVATGVKSYRLTKTVIETICMFKLGTSSATDPKQIEWFEDIMKKQYNVVPKLDVSNLNVHTLDEDEIATNDTCTVELDVARPHAENFTKQKIAACQKQGIPPQVGLQSYREGWWILVRAEKLGVGKVPATDALSGAEKTKLGELLQVVDLSKFSGEVQDRHLLTAWPMTVTNVAQKSGKIKLKFTAPAVAGKYRFYISIQSQEFLGADLQLTCEREIVDEAAVSRPEEEDEDKEEEEQKKDK